MQQILLFFGEINTYTTLLGPTRLLIFEIFFQNLIFTYINEKKSTYSALLGTTRLLISEKSSTYTINWSYTIIWQVRVIDFSISDNLKATVASITDTHDKDIEEVTETLCDVAKRLDSIQNGRY